VEMENNSKTTLISSNDLSSKITITNKDDENERHSTYELGNNGASRCFRIPPGEYSKELFCKILNKICNELPLLYDYYYGCYTSYDPQDHNFQTLRFSPDLLKFVEKNKIDITGKYKESDIQEQEKLDEMIVKFYKNRYLRKIRYNKNPKIWLKQAIQACMRGMMWEDRIENGMRFLNNQKYKDMLCLKLFEEYRKSRIRFEYDVKTNKVIVHFYGKSVSTFADYLAVPKRIAEWLGFDEIITQDTKKYYRKLDVHYRDSRYMNLDESETESEDETDNENKESDYEEEDDDTEDEDGEEETNGDMAEIFQLCCY